MRRITNDVGAALIRVLLGSRWGLAEGFASFLESRGEGTNVTKDLWRMTLEFSKDFPSSFEGFDPEGHWNSTLVAFVAASRSERS